MKDKTRLLYIIVPAIAIGITLAIFLWSNTELYMWELPPRDVSTRSNRTIYNWTNKNNWWLVLGIGAPMGLLVCIMAVQVKRG